MKPEFLALGKLCNMSSFYNVKNSSRRSHTLGPAELQGKDFKFQAQTGEINSRATWEANSAKVAFLSAGTGLCQLHWNDSPVASQAGEAGGTAVIHKKPIKGASKSQKSWWFFIELY